MSETHPWPLTHSAALLLVLGFFLYSLQPWLNPFVLYLVVLALIVSQRRAGEYPLLVPVVTLLTLFWVLVSTGYLLAPFLVAMGLAYLLDPVVDRLEGRGLGRTLSIMVLITPVLVLLAVHLQGRLAVEAQVGGDLGALLPGSVGSFLGQGRGREGQGRGDGGGQRSAHGASSWCWDQRGP